MGIAFTVIENTIGPAAKTFSFKSDGSLDKRSAAQIFEGIARRVEVASLERFIKFRASLTSNQALCYGVTGATSARIVSQRDLPASPGAIARDREHFEFAGKRPGVLMLDHDTQPGGKIYSALELDAILCAAVPAIEAVQRVWVPSSSAFIYDANGREIIGPGGWRCYLVVDDASRIPDIGAMIYQALWKAGYGCALVTKSGAILDRTIIDASVWQPERLDFAAAPILGPGLERRAPGPLIIPGEPMLRTGGLKPEMSMAEWRKSSDQLASAKKRVKPEAEKAEDAFVKERIAEHKRRGTYSKHVKSVWKDAVINRTLKADFELVMEGGDRVTVKQVLDNAARYDGARCADPLEPDYRGDNRIGYIRLGNNPAVYSHAHGGARFTLCSYTDEVKIIKGGRSNAVDGIIEIMRRRGDLYQRGGELVQVIGSKIIHMDEARLSYYLGRSVRFLKPYEVKEGQFEWLPTDVPAQVVKEVLAKREWGLRELKGVISAPTLRPNGSVLCKPGYDAATGHLLVENNYPSIPPNPTEGQLERAWGTLWRAFNEFPFASRFDRGVMAAAILTALTRHLYPTAPAFSFEAPAAGSGKTKLSMCLQALAGMQPTATPKMGDDDEMRKMLASFLRGGQPVLLLDNLDGEFVSRTLEALLTSPTFETRKLGSNDLLTQPSTITVLLSGNSMCLGGDLFRRALRCRIDAKTERPECRSFTLEPVQYCVGHRQEIVAAALTLMRGFFAAGCPRDPSAGGKLGSFDRWDDLVRQSVLWLNREGIADLGDPTHCVQVTKASEPGRQLLATFLHSVFERCGSEPWQVKDLIFYADRGTDLHDVMQEVAGDRHASGGINARKLGRWIASHRGTRAGGLYLEQREQSERDKSPVRWFVRSEHGSRAGTVFGQADHSGRAH